MPWPKSVVDPSIGHDWQTVMRCLADGRGGLTASDAYLVPVEMVLAFFDTLTYQAVRADMAAPVPAPPKGSGL
mgnify:CR=1 FL=1